MALVTNLPTNATPALSDYVITDDGTTTSKSTIGSLPLAQIASMSLSLGAATYSINIPSSSRHMIVLASLTSSLNAILIVGANSSGTMTVVEVYKGNNITTGSTTNTLTITTGSATTVSAFDFILSGNGASLN